MNNYFWFQVEPLLVPWKTLYIECYIWNPKGFYLEPKRLSYGDSRKNLLEPFFLRLYLSIPAITSNFNLTLPFEMVFLLFHPTLPSTQSKSHLSNPPRPPGTGLVCLPDREWNCSIHKKVKGVIIRRLGEAFPSNDLEHLSRESQLTSPHICY